MRNLTWIFTANSATFVLGALALKVPETKIADYANSADLDEVAHNEPPHLDLHCLTSNL